MNELNPKLIKESFLLATSMVENSKVPGLIIKAIEKKGIQNNISRLIVIASFKIALAKCNLNIKSSKKTFIIGLIAFPIGLFITIWTFMQHVGVFIVAIGPVVIGGGFLVYSIYDIYEDFFKKREIMETMEQLGQNLLISDSGLYVAYDKPDMSEAIVEFINANFNNLLRTNNYYSIKAFSSSGQLLNLVYIDTDLTEAYANIGVLIEEKFNVTYLIYDNSNKSIIEWIKSASVELKRNIVC